MERQLTCDYPRIWRRSWNDQRDGYGVSALKSCVRRWNITLKANWKCAPLSACAIFSEVFPAGDLMWASGIANT